MADEKQVKVDNWGIYFLQRLKHFFNRTDYCDLTLQFQDNAQLKVHRLVLNACTEYFELLERTCEMYEDCLVMPDDLQADVVVPIINFMYTGQLEFKVELLEKLYQTSLVMNMPVLTKLLESHRNQPQTMRPAPTHIYGNKKTSRKYESSKQSKQAIASSSSQGNKAVYSNVYTEKVKPNRPQKVFHPTLSSSEYQLYAPPTPSTKITKWPRPTRYELPEGLDTDELVESSFTSISYTSQPLMVHPETVKRYPSKRPNIFSEESTSKKLSRGTGILDIVECKKVKMNENLFDDNYESMHDEIEMFPAAVISNKDKNKDASQLFDQIIDEGPKISIETKNNKQAGNIDHAKIISEVLKKYPHLVKSNKNIKLKILNKPKKKLMSEPIIKKEVKTKPEPVSMSYETDVLDSKEAAKLISMGAENIHGPWICLICGTPGKALHFTSYYKFRRHLVEVHNEKPVSNICEHCGLKSFKAHYLVYHLYTKHGIQPPSRYNFPKCNICNYVALSEGLLVRHKLSHSTSKQFFCNVCSSSFHMSHLLLEHIQKTGHKYSAEKKNNLQCIYCLKNFLRETNLYAHLKIYHKTAAKNDGIIDDSDEEKKEDQKQLLKPIVNKIITPKYEVPVSYENEYEEDDVQFQIHESADGAIQVISKKSPIAPTNASVNHKILNPGFNTPQTKTMQKSKSKNTPIRRHEKHADMDITTNVDKRDEEIVVIDNNEYIMRDNQLIPRNDRSGNSEYILSDLVPTDVDETMIPTSMTYASIHDTSMHHPKMIIKKQTNMNQPIQIVVSNEEEYKALMSSNHSIIFDDGDSNKTLTVLAPHDSQLQNTTIDLDAAQSNDMMIIQEDYPLNVSETVSDNSNIVVVYSHPIDDANKQYQLIASQGIETQFVQTSAMITQNYETVTTSTPVMSAHVIDAPIEESWQNNMSQVDKLQLHSDTQLQPVAVSEHITVAPVTSEASNNINDLPEVDLTPIAAEPLPIQTEQVIQVFNQPEEINTHIQPDITDTQNQENTIDETNTIDSIEQTNTFSEQSSEHEHVNQSNTIENEESTTMDNISPHANVNIDNIDESNNMEPNAMSYVSLDQSDMGHEVNQQNVAPTFVQDIPVITTPDAHVDGDDIDRTIIGADVPINQPNENELNENTNVLTSEASMPEINTEHLVEEETVTEHVVEEISQNIDNDKIEMQHITSNSNNNDVEMECIEPESHPVQEKDLNEEVTMEVAKEKIQNLTSEWSEDELETEQEQDNEDKSVPMETENTSEIEESIENIQQEVHKQIAGVSDIQNNIATPENEAIVQEESNSNVIAATNTTEKVSAPIEKISSLLNEWEDNDSQEETQESLNSVADQNNENNETSNDVVQPEVQKIDKIKSLVSDWDEEEEENNA